MKCGVEARLVAISGVVVAAFAGLASAQGLVVDHAIGDYLLNGGGAPGTGIGYYNGSYGGYGGYGGFRGGGFGPYGGFNGVDFLGYRPGGFSPYPNYGLVTSFARPPAFQPPHVITTEPDRGGEVENRGGPNVGESGVRYHGGSGRGPRIGDPGRVEPASLGVERRVAPGAAALRPGGIDAYRSYHAAWLHGYWNGNRNGAWVWRSPGGGTGRIEDETGLGWGLPAWGSGSSLYAMGCLTYTNPYCSEPAAAGSPYDYTRPIDTAASPADATIARPALALFDAARAAFKQENYGEALRQTEAALGRLPRDPALHEFRALCLFALTRYDEAAATLYAVISVRPGWDWTTLVGLYPSIEVYTAQLRALEAYCRSHESASAWFVLSCHYLSQGFPDAAVTALRHVRRLDPSDALAAGLLRRLDARQASEPAVSDPRPPDGATIEGTWTASPADGAVVTMSVAADGRFTWTVAEKSRDQPRVFHGTSTFADGVLTLILDQGSALVGRVTWDDASHMTFRIVGEAPSDPGLRFLKRKPG